MNQMIVVRNTWGTRHVDIILLNEFGTVSSNEDSNVSDKEIEYFVPLVIRQ
jgi:hypothetical protein